MDEAYPKRNSKLRKLPRYASKEIKIAIFLKVKFNCSFYFFHFIPGPTVDTEAWVHYLKKIS